MFASRLTPAPSLSKPRSLLVATAGLMVGIALPTAANAQMADQNPTKPSFTLGLGVVHAPEYEGSDWNKTRALPNVSYRNGRFFAGALGGVGYNISNVPNLEFGPVLSYRLGRDESDSARLRGMGDIQGGADLGAYARWNLKPFALHANIKQGVSGDVTGTRLNVGLGYQMALGQKDRLALDASVEWADSEVMQAHYGVSATQSTSSGLSSYQASSGVRRYGVGAAWVHSFTPQWSSSVSLGVYRLGAAATDSPLALKRHVGVVGASLAYRF